jgi:putative lipoic acid-binding regulatory protein
MTIRDEIWEFPHSMTLKVMGSVDAPLRDAVVAILEQHLDDFDHASHLSETLSSKGNYVSLSAQVVMRNRDQVIGIYAALDASEHVKVVF